MELSLAILAYDKTEIHFESLQNEFSKRDLNAEFILCRNSIEIISTLKESKPNLILLFDIDSSLSLQGIKDILPSDNKAPIIIITNEYNRSHALSLIEEGAANVFALAETQALTSEIQRMSGNIKQTLLIQEQRNSIRKGQERFSTLVNKLPVAVAFVQQGALLNINNAFTKLFKLEEISDISATSILDIISNKDRDKIKYSITELENTNKSVSTTLKNIDCITHNNDTINTDIILSNTNFNGESCVQTIVLTNNTLSENINIKHLTLTQSLAPEYFTQQLNKYIRQRDSEKTYALCLVEARDYARTKKNIGITRSEKIMHQVHDKMITFSSDDILVSQAGTDIFYILVIKPNAQECLHVMENIQNNFQDNKFSIENYEIKMPLNIGMVYLKHNITSPDQAFSLADVACTVARNRDDTSIHVYNQEQDRSTVEDLDQNWSNSIRDAIANDNFKLVFQPIISLKSPGIANYEVLLRMKGNDGQDILPNQFLHAARQNSLELDIDRWVIENAVNTLALTHQQNTSVFIKLGESSVCSLDFIQWLKSLPAEEKQKMVLEISEEVALKWPSETLNLLQERQQSGYRVCIEHFGNHPESSAELFEMAADFYKIDGAFSSHLATNRKHQSIIHKIALSSKGRNIKTIACFVQDADSMAILWQEGYDYIQGNYLQPPGSDLSYQFDSIL